MVKLVALSSVIAATFLASISSANTDGPVPLPAPPVPAVPTASSAAPAAEAAKPKISSDVVALHHAPPATATAHNAFKLSATIDNPHTIKRALLVYRTAKDATYREVPFLRAADGYLAEIPGESVDYPSLSYTIELETADGARSAAFATRAEPHLVDVPGDLDDARETALLERVGGTRSVITTSGELVSFGHTTATTSTGNKTVLDHWYRIEATYTYRPLRTIMEFGVRAGIVRGVAPVPFEFTPAGETTAKKDTFDVGLNYGTSFVVFRASDEVHLEGHLLASVTEVGFSTGIGSAIHIGDYFGTKLILGFEHVALFGTRGYSRLDLVRGRVRVSPIVEVTDMPHADRPGVRLLTELGLNLGQGFGVALRGGYQARDFRSGGAGGGVAISYAF
jgi:hypothetical protein